MLINKMFLVKASNQSKEIAILTKYYMVRI